MSRATAVWRVGCAAGGWCFEYSGAFRDTSDGQRNGVPAISRPER